MIQKHYILYNVDASQKVTMLEFDLALFKDHYTITKSIYSYNHAKKRITTFTSSKGFNGRTLQQQAFRDLEDRTNEFIQKGYRKLSYAVQKKLDQLTIDDLIDGFGEIRKDKNNIHKHTRDHYFIGLKEIGSCFFIIVSCIFNCNILLSCI